MWHVCYIHQHAQGSRSEFLLLARLDPIKTFTGFKVKGKVGAKFHVEQKAEPNAEQQRRKPAYNPLTQLTPSNFPSSQHGATRQLRLRWDPTCASGGQGTEPGLRGDNSQRQSGRRHSRRRRRGRRRLCLVCQPRGSRRGGALSPPSGGRRLPLRKAREPRDTGASPRGRRRSAATYRPHPAPPSQQPRGPAAPFAATHPPSHPHGRRDGAAGPHLSTEGRLGRIAPLLRSLPGGFTD